MNQVLRVDIEEPTPAVSEDYSQVARGPAASVGGHDQATRGPAASEGRRQVAQILLQVRSTIVLLRMGAPPSRAGSCREWGAAKPYESFQKRKRRALEA